MRYDKAMSNTQTTSRIAASTADILLAIFAGQTVTNEQLGAQIEFQYAAARKRTGFASYVQIHNAIEAAGVTVEHDLVGYNHRYTFPAA